MKKKEMVNKGTKSKSTDISHKKVSVIKKVIKKQQPELFIFLGDNFYVAETKTQRKNYKDFEQKIKIAKTPLKKSRVKSMNKHVENINIQQYVKLLSKQQKQKLFKDLSEEMKSENHDQIPLPPKNQDKLQLFLQKLQNIKVQLLNRWDYQINQINIDFENEHIGLQQKNQKIVLVQKIRDNKMSMLSYTQVLFERILKEEPDIQLQKEEKIEHIINSLDQIAQRQIFQTPLELNKDFQYKEEEKRRDYELKARQNYEKIIREKELYQFYHEETFLPVHPPKQVQISPLYDLNYHTKYDKYQRDIKNQVESQDQEMIKERPQQIILQQDTQNIEESSQDFQPSALIFNKESLKLDIRFDEVQFGKDHYDNTQKQQEQKVSPSNSINLNALYLKNENIEKMNPVNDTFNGNFKRINDEEFVSISEQNSKILKIPMLMTKDRLQQIQMQKAVKEVEMLNAYMKSKQSFQLSEINIDGIPHFTTLVDVNQFVVQFYQFLMKVEMQEAIDGLNVPYGKSCVDKLRILRKQGSIPHEDNNNILKQEYLDSFHMQFQLNVRKLSEHERVHNRAVFDAFNFGLNVYRPFFQLQGEVYPWTTSQKGLTFYQISEDNIEQVFEKSKMKVLEYSASLCGLIPGCDTTTEQAKKILQKRNVDCYERILKSEIIQRYTQWNIGKVNFEALFRLTLSEQLFQQQIQLLCQELLELKRD